MEKAPKSSLHPSSPRLQIHARAIDDRSGHDGGVLAKGMPESGNSLGQNPGTEKPGFPIQRVALSPTNLFNAEAILGQFPCWDGP